MKRRIPTQVEDFLKKNFVLRPDDSVDLDMWVALAQAEKLHEETRKLET